MRGVLGQVPPRLLFASEPWLLIATAGPIAARKVYHFRDATKMTVNERAEQVMKAFAHALMDRVATVESSLEMGTEMTVKDVDKAALAVMAWPDWMPRTPEQENPSE